MAIETFSNVYVTTLSGNGGSISSGATTINVTSGTGAPSGKARFVIGSEIIVGSMSGTVLTATIRGAEGTTASSHLDGAAISHVLTAASLLAEPGGMTTAGDLTYLNSSGQPSRLAIGASGQALVVAGGLPSWGSASSSLENEHQASVLVNATSAGDAGGRADHFTGSALSGSWSVASGSSFTSGQMSPLVANSSFNYTTPTGAGNTFGGWVQAYTPSGTFQVEARVGIYGIPNGQNTFFGVADSNFANFVGIALQTGDGAGYSQFHRSGGAGNFGDCFFNGGYSASSATPFSPQPWMYVRVNYTAGAFQVYVSMDRNRWIVANGSALSVSFTPAFLVLAMGNSVLSFSYDFVDVTL